MREEFIQSIKKYQAAFDLNLSENAIDSLADYYEIIQEHNAILHLVAPSMAEEFATRHILESLTLLEFLPKKAKFADIGTGAGLPSIPCLIARDDLRGVLIESKLKKANFLEEALAKCNLENRARIINRQFEEIEKPDVSYVLCRALDKFTQKTSAPSEMVGQIESALFRRQFPARRTKQKPCSIQRKADADV